MYYNDDEVKDNLKCPKCKEEYKDPRYLPCFETICQKCIDDLKVSLKGNSTIKCPLCSKEHQIPSDGFVPNKLIAKLLKMQPREVYQGAVIEEFKSALKSIETKLDELNAARKDHIAPVRHHCSRLRNEVELAAEVLHVKVNSLKDDLFAELKKYENEFEENLENTLEYSEEQEFVGEADEFRSSNMKMLKDTDLNESAITKLLEEANEFLSKIVTKLANPLDYITILINENKPKFVMNRNKIETSLLGEIICEPQTSSKKEHIFQSFDLKEIPEFFVSEGTRTTIKEFGRDKFVLCFYDKDYELNVKLFDATARKVISTNEYKFKAQSHKACANQSYFFLYIESSSCKSTMFKFSADLANSDEYASKPDIISIGANSEHLFCLGRFRIYKYDLDLNLVATIELSIDLRDKYAVPCQNGSTIIKADDNYVFYHNGYTLAAISLKEEKTAWRLCSEINQENFVLVDYFIVSFKPSEKKLAYYNREKRLVGDYTIDGETIESECISFGDSDWAYLQLVDVSLGEIAFFDTRKFVLFTCKPKKWIRLSKHAVVATLAEYIKESLLAINSEKQTFKINI